MIHIDQERCKACGICGYICPRHITETIESDNSRVTIISSERLDLCMECGHCMAICPNEAIYVNGLNSKEFDPAKELDIDENQLLTLMKQRRSVRRYRKESVPRETLNRIIEAAHQSPTGTGRRTTGIIILDNPETIDMLSEMVYELYEKLDRNLQNPIARFFIRRQVGQKMMNTLQDFVMPGMRWYIRWYRENKSNEIMRDCPALMLFHSPILEPMGAENCLVTAFHAIFMAQVVGIGTCFNDLIPQACNRVPEIRRLLDLPKDREVYSSITLGYPKVKFKRTIPRRLAEARYLQ